MAKYALLWTDNDGDAHVRLLEGTEVEADTAIELLRAKYEDGEGFHNDRIIEAYEFGPLEVIQGEYDEYLSELAADSDEEPEPKD